ncbi:MAG: hypothetical protein GY795_37970 [Desulfobacterales bacterium]|nr:hypothetical protein [Desulfobacterales bacterium]
MTEFNYKELGKHLKEKQFAPVYLIHGEEMLCKTAYNELLDALIPLSERTINYEPVDNDNIYEAIERANTFSLLAGIKVVALCDSQVFYSKQDENSFFEKAKQAYDEKNMKKAAKYFVNALGLLNLSFDDVASKANRDKNLKLDAEILADNRWLDSIITHCTDNKISVSAPKDNAGDLQKSIEKGFPEGNHLIITTDIIDKRRGLFKAIAEKGIVINCSVPKGNRKADIMEQDAVLKERMAAILSKTGKTIEPNAYLALREMTGFDLRTFSNNLEQLAVYTGDRKKITAADVDSVLKRTKQDPIYELTNAVADRNTEQALFFLDSLLSAGYFSLQILSAITNQIRKILLVKSFVESPHGKVWRKGVQYSYFQKSVMPAIQEFDKILLTELEKWETALSADEDTTGGNVKKKGKKKKPVTDIVIVKSPNNPYPVYQMFMKSEKFMKTDILNAIECLSEADLQIKSSGQNHKLILEKAIFQICN